MLTQEQIDNPNCWANIDIDNVAWFNVCFNKTLSEEFMRTFHKKMHWDHISEYQQLSEDFIREFKNKVHWNRISKHQQLSESFIREFQDYVYWYFIPIFQKLSEEFIREFQDKVDWEAISTSQSLSEDFIREFKDKIDWGCISRRQKLSEDFIREFKDKIDWLGVSIYQQLSEEFIREFQNYVYWFEIIKYQKLSENFRRKFGLIFNLRMPRNNWLYASLEEKREKVKDFYELDGDYVIAYKSTKINGYSLYNSQYKYEVGGIYESNCDCNLVNDNSFGLSAWTKKRALKYHSRGKLFKVRIHLNDLGAITSENKLRCFKLEIIEELHKHN